MSEQHDDEDHSPLSIYFQVPNASLSLLASGLIAIMAALPKNGGLCTPYRRIIFGLSIADILQSFSLLIGPWFVPPPWGIGNLGNDTSCRAIGFMLSLGSSAVMMYMPSLCLYYLCKLRFRMTNDEFYIKIERKVHIVIILFNLIVACMALGMDVFHTNSEHRTFCLYASTPTGCRFDSDIIGDCDEVIMKRVTFFIIFMLMLLPVISLSVIIVTMTMVVQHVWAISALNLHGGRSFTSLRNRQKKRARRNEEGENISTSSNNADVNVNRNQQSQPPPAQVEVVTFTPRENLMCISDLYRRETATQLCCYVGAFIFAYLPIGISVFVAVFDKYLLLLGYISIFLYPLGGLLNIIVYTRPYVTKLRRQHPSCSRIRAFWLVLKSGGSEPDEVEPLEHYCCCCCCIPLSKYDEYTDSKWSGVHLSDIGF